MSDTAVTFDIAFHRLIDHEGGFQDQEEDRGNWTTGIIGQGECRGTKYGISAMSYPQEDIRNLTLERAKELYQRDFWDRMKCEQYAPSLRFQMFDIAVNHGPGNAIRMLQRAVGVADDGGIGAVTLRAVTVRPTMWVILRLNAERLRFFTKLSNWGSYGKGWARRVAGNLNIGACDAENDPA